MKNPYITILLIFIIIISYFLIDIRQRTYDPKDFFSELIKLELTQFSRRILTDKEYTRSFKYKIDKALLPWKYGLKIAAIDDKKKIIDYRKRKAKKWYGYIYFLDGFDQTLLPAAISHKRTRDTYTKYLTNNWYFYKYD